MTRHRSERVSVVAIRVACAMAAMKVCRSAAQSVTTLAFNAAR